MHHHRENFNERLEPKETFRFFSIVEALRKKVDDFFNEKNQKAIDKETQIAIEPFINGEIEIKDVLDKWLKLIEVRFVEKRKSFSKTFFAF